MCKHFGSRYKLLGKIDFGHTIKVCMGKLMNLSKITRDIMAVINTYSAII
jgi:hypothetical protein